MPPVAAPSVLGAAGAARAAGAAGRGPRCRRCRPAPPAPPLAAAGAGPGGAAGRRAPPVAPPVAASAAGGAAAGPAGAAAPLPPRATGAAAGAPAEAVAPGALSLQPAASSEGERQDAQPPGRGRGPTHRDGEVNRMKLHGLNGGWRASQRPAWRSTRRDEFPAGWHTLHEGRPIVPVNNCNLGQHSLGRWRPTTAAFRWRCAAPSSGFCPRRRAPAGPGCAWPAGRPVPGPCQVPEPGKFLPGAGAASPAVAANFGLLLPGRRARRGWQFVCDDGYSTAPPDRLWRAPGGGFLAGSARGLAPVRRRL